MAVSNNYRLARKQMVEMVRRAGEYISDNAEDIVGDNYESLVDLHVNVYVKTNMDEIAKISIERNVIPKQYFEYVASDQFVIDGRSDQEVKDDKT
jgi:hypothetical protein